MGTHTWNSHVRRPRIDPGEVIVTIMDDSNDIIITQVWQWEKRTTDSFTGPDDKVCGIERVHWRQTPPCSRVLAHSP
jgi:hypothetical protein